MKPPSLRRQIVAWLLGTLCAGALLLLVSAYWLTLAEIDEVLDDGLRQTALLLADRDLATALPTTPMLAAGLDPQDTESKLLATARRPDGSLLFSSDPLHAPRFEAIPGASLQQAAGRAWHVYTVVQSDRIVQVAQPAAVRRESAAESASQLLLPLLLLVALIGSMLLVALKRGLRPLERTSTALAERGAASLAPLDEAGVPRELLPLVRTLNDLLARLSVAFEAQRRFVADAAHELRSPVTALQLQAQVLANSHEPTERAVAMAELSAGIQRTRRLIEQLLALSRASADDGSGAVFAHQPVALDELVKAVVSRCSAEAEQRGIDLGAEVQVACAVAGDATLLESLLVNLVENALRYSGRGAVVDVVATSIDGRPALVVVDTGPGIAADERARVFDRFYRSPQAIAGTESGSGLGLAIVKLIADAHGAELSLHEGRGGRGLEVRVRFASAP